MNVTLPALHKAQTSIGKSRARFRVVCCGRRFGKTRLAIVLALAEALQGGAVMWIAPSYDKAKIGWRLFEELCIQIPGAKINRGDHRLVFPGGGWINVLSADTQGGLRGEGLTLVIVDECAHIRNFMDIWEQEIRPSLTDRKGGAIFISTPKGFNHFYEFFRKADNSTAWQSWQLPSSLNPFLDPAELADAKKELPALVYRQEYDAEFVQLAGAMFRREWFEIIDQPPEITMYSRHWDIAASKSTQADMSSGSKVGMDKDGNGYILDVIRGRWEYPALLRIIAQTAQADGIQVRQSVETGGTQKGVLDLLLAEPVLAGIPFRGLVPTSDKIVRANSWLARAEQGRIKLIRGDWNGAWLDEVCSFPEGEHDDQVDSTSGAFSDLTDGGFEILFGA